MIREATIAAIVPPVAVRSSAYNLVPPIRIPRPIRPLHAHDAEALAAWRLHYHPAFEAFEYRRPEFFQPRDFRFDVVGFDVQVHATFVFDALQLHHRFIRQGRELPVLAAAAWMIRVHRTAERRGPEAGRRVDIIDVAVDLH